MATAFKDRRAFFTAMVSILVTTNAGTLSAWVQISNCVTMQCVSATDSEMFVHARTWCLGSKWIRTGSNSVPKLLLVVNIRASVSRQGRVQAELCGQPESRGGQTQCAAHSDFMTARAASMVSSMSCKYGVGLKF